MALQSHGARRRYVLVIILLSALTLATLDQRAGQSGPIGTVGDAVHRVVQPFASGADTVFSPVHDWFDSLIHSGHLKSDNRRLREQIAALRARERVVNQAILDNRYYKSFFGKPFLDDYTTVGAWVQSGAIDNLSHTITINRGTEKGIVEGMAVIAGDGLVGRIYRSWNGGSQVLLATDPTFGAAITMVGTGTFGTAQTQPDHRMRVVFSVDTRHPNLSAFKPGDVAQTCGCASSDFPPGIPVGSVVSSLQSGPDVIVRLAPFVDFGALDVVKVVKWSSGDPVPKSVLPSTTTVPRTTTAPRPPRCPAPPPRPRLEDDVRPLRYLPLAVAVVITQVALFPQLRIAGVVPDLGLLFALAIAWYDGSETGALFGFAVGCTYDLFLTTPLGMSGLAYAVCAWLVGLARGTIARRSRLLAAGIGLAGGMVSGTLFVAASILAGADQLQRPAVIGVILKAACYDAVLAPAMFGLVTLLRGRRNLGLL